ncbi:MAG: TolC family protein [Muribaculaceae bacterium]|nr:TolC family protein [Muribaculaceae bacterium]
MKRIRLTRLPLFSCLLAASVMQGYGRELRLTLDDAIAMARVQSVEAASALDELRTAYWEWRTFRADQLPELSFTATAPSYAKQYSSYMNENGDYSFVRTNTLQAHGELSVNQNVALTGGKVSLSSSLDFLRQLDGAKYNRFMTVPIALTLDQPLFGVNTMKWDRRIEPVRYSEAKAAFLSATEDVARLTVDYYFNLLMSMENVAIAEQNLENASLLYAVAQEKREMGKISRNDLLQMELNEIEARSELTDTRSSLKAMMFQLRSFLGLGEDVEIIPVVPENVPSAEISYGDALAKATENNKFMKSMLREQLEADYEVARAKGDMREIKLFARIGYSGTDPEIGGAYGHLKSNQLASVGFSIPLVDWGKRRGKVKVAESKRRVSESRIRQETLNFNQELFILVERFTNQQEQLALSTRASEIASQRYQTNVETYLIGMLSPLELNDSRSSKDSSRREYVTQLYKFWTYWYQLRSLTLYDYSGRCDINADFEKLVKYM